MGCGVHYEYLSEHVQYIWHELVKGWHTYLVVDFIHMVQHKYGSIHLYVNIYVGFSPGVGRSRWQTYLLNLPQLDPSMLLAK